MCYNVQDPVVLFGMLGDVLQGSQDGVGHRRRDRQMFATRLKTVFIGNVAHGDGIAAGVGVAERSLNANSVLVFVDLGESALLLHLDAISGLVVVAVRAVRIRSVEVRSHDRDEIILRNNTRGRGECNHRERAEEGGRLEEICFFLFSFYD